ncbi:hypothetical protein JMJ56_09280 [Belnapia sp. T18]|uniref:Uncharacterized protein n=1 Tax=Belnapia arida TaxID=2804533 RepID=A0ABS1U0J1_9PROT|nr:hypothetical protein [Belnapia arida]MBL6078196.1 hypothetical protein [Belnapia arida]
MLGAALVAAAVAVINWSGVWAAAAVVISLLHQLQNLLHRTQVATSFMSSLRENEYRRVMNDITVLTKQSETTFAEMRGLRHSLTAAGLISDEAEYIRRLKNLTARLQGSRSEPNT